MRHSILILPPFGQAVRILLHFTQFCIRRQVSHPPMDHGSMSRLMFGLTKATRPGGLTPPLDTPPSLSSLNSPTPPTPMQLRCQLPVGHPSAAKMQLLLICPIIACTMACDDSHYTDTISKGGGVLYW